jgi:hypothetical protein
MDEGDVDLQWVVPYTPGSRTAPGAVSLLTIRPYEGTGSFFANTTPSTPIGFAHPGNDQGTPLQFLPIDTPQARVPSQNDKRRRAGSTATEPNDENIPPASSEAGSSKRAKTSGSRQKSRTDSERLQAVFASLQEQGWTLGEFLYRTFHHNERDGSRTQRHAVRSLLGSER